MKKIFAIFLIQASILTISAQTSSTPPSNFRSLPPNTQYSTTSSDSLPKVYFGIGTGVNNYVGILGVGVDVRIYKPLLLRAGVGIGSWGTKFTIGLRYEVNPTKNGWVYGVAYSHCTGLSGFQEQLQIDTASTTVTKQVTLDLNPASTVNLTASYNWIFHKHNKFYIEFGYAIPLQSNPYVVENTVLLSATSKTVINTISPGGIVIDCGFMFRLY